VAAGVVGHIGAEGLALVHGLVHGIDPRQLCFAVQHERPAKEGVISAQACDGVADAARPVDLAPDDNRREDVLVGSAGLFLNGYFERVLVLGMVRLVDR